MIPFAFLPGQAKLIALAVVALAFALVTAWGLYWRGEAREARIAVTTLKAQGDVLAGAVKTCNQGVEEAAKAGEAAKVQGAALLAEAKRLAAGGRAQAERIERLLEQPTKPGEDCRHAWRAIEDNRKAGAAR